MTPCFIANWKMYKTGSEAEAYLRTFANQFALLEPATEIVIAPPATALAPLRACIDALALPVTLAAQNLHAAPEGAYTGELSARMLREAGCRYVLIGHSERRTHFGETDAQICLKIKAAGEAGLIPILCVGETLRQRQMGEGESVVQRQVEVALGDNRPSEVVIAYEPVWAIGTGKTPSPTEVAAMHRHIRTSLAPFHNVRILYGGSVTPQNIAGFMQECDIEGALVGGQSLSVGLFMTIIEQGMKSKMTRRHAAIGVASA